MENLGSFSPDRDSIMDKTVAGATFSSSFERSILTRKPDKSEEETERVDVTNGVTEVGFLNQKDPNCREGRGSREMSMPTLNLENQEDYEVQRVDSEITIRVSKKPGKIQGELNPGGTERSAKLSHTNSYSDSGDEMPFFQSLREDINKSLSLPFSAESEHILNRTNRGEHSLSHRERMYINQGKSNDFGMNNLYKSRVGIENPEAFRNNQRDQYGQNYDSDYTTVKRTEIPIRDQLFQAGNRNGERRLFRERGNSPNNNEQHYDSDNYYYPAVRQTEQELGDRLSQTGNRGGGNSMIREGGNNSNIEFQRAERVRYLFEKKMRNECDEAEEDELADWLDNRRGSTREASRPSKTEVGRTNYEKQYPERKVNKINLNRGKENQWRENTKESISESEGSSKKAEPIRPKRKIAKKTSSSSSSSSSSSASEKSVKFNPVRRNKTYLKPIKYEGKTSFETFLANFENCAACNGWTNREKVYQLRGIVEGPAAEILLGFDQMATYAELIQELQTSFGNSGLELQYESQLRTRKRGKGESLQNLYQDVNRLSLLAYPGLKCKLRDRLSVDSFITSLNDPDLEIKVRDKMPEDLLACYKAAQVIDANFKIVNGEETRDRRREQRRDIQARVLAAEESGKEEMVPKTQLDAVLKRIEELENKGKVNSSQNTNKGRGTWSEKKFNRQTNEGQIRNVWSGPNNDQFKGNFNTQNYVQGPQNSEQFVASSYWPNQSSENPATRGGGQTSQNSFMPRWRDNEPPVLANNTVNFENRRVPPIHGVGGDGIRNGQQGPRKFNNEIICWQCGLKGHVQKFCKFRNNPPTTTYPQQI